MGAELLLLLNIRKTDIRVEIKAKTSGEGLKLIRFIFAIGVPLGRFLVTSLPGPKQELKGNLLKVRESLKSMFPLQYFPSVVVLLAT